jgi:hypothetical protein
LCAIVLTACGFLNIERNDRAFGEVMGRSGIILEEASPAELQGSISRDAAVAIAAADADLGVASVTSASLGRMSATPPGGPEQRAHPIVWVVVWHEPTSTMVRIVDAKTSEVISRGSSNR